MDTGASWVTGKGNYAFFIRLPVMDGGAGTGHEAVCGIL